MAQVSFNLNFTGMCSFVPRSNKELTVLLPDAREGHGVVGHEPHYAVLDFDIAQLVTGGGNRNADLTYFTKQSFQRGIVFLDVDDISVSGASSNSLNIPDGTHGSCPDPASGDKFEWLSWIAPVEKISKGCGKIRSDCIAKPGNIPDVAARFQITQGDLAVVSFSFDGGKLIKWHFETLAGVETYEQALGDVVQVKRLIDSTGQISLVDSNGSQPVVFQTNGVNLDIFVKNLPLDDILDRRPNPLPPGVENHFAHHYRISGNGTPTVVIPVFKKEFCPATPPNVGSPKCPPALFTE